MSGAELGKASTPEEEKKLREEKKRRAARIGISINAQESANILSSQTATAVAIVETVATHSHAHPSDTAVDAMLIEDREIGIVAGVIISIIAAIIWLVTNQKDLEAYSKIKNELNPWWRRLKAAAMFGLLAGQLAAEFLVPEVPFLPAWMLLPVKLLVSLAFGIIFGVIALFIPHDSEMLSEGPKSIFRIGRDGWDRYAKAGMKLGQTLGAGLGIFLPIPGMATALMAIGSALGGIIGFVSFAIFVPIINKIRYWLNPAQQLAGSAEVKNNNPDTIVDIVSAMAAQHQYRTNYFTLGIYAGSAIGAIVAVCSLAIPHLRHSFL